MLPDSSRINKALGKEFKELDRAYLNLLGEQDKKLIASYRTALKSVQDKIAQTYRDFGDKPTITQLRKYDRLTKIETDILKRLNELESEVKTYISKQRKYSLVVGKRDSATIINKTFGVEFVPARYSEASIVKYLEDTLWIDALKVSTSKLFTEIKREFETILRANAREEIISGALEGKSIRELSKYLMERFDVGYNRAKVIAWTETHKFYNIGRNDSINEAIENAPEYGLKAFKVWRHNGIGKPRPEHVEADGQRADENGMFNVGGEELEAPGLGTDPANNINCHCTIDLVIEKE